MTIDDIIILPLPNMTGAWTYPFGALYDI